MVMIADASLFKSLRQTLVATLCPDIQRKAGKHSIA
jgi:hypothetical protein